MYLFQASYPNAEGQYRNHDFDAGDEAALAVEAAGGGSVVKFRKERNLPHCLPEFVLKSMCLWVFENGKWMRKGIHGPTATDIGEERPQ